jgi:transglutaminase-like putative cysteine protease
MNHRLTAISAAAVVLASLSLFSVLTGAGWLLAGIGAAAAIGVAGTLTRLGSGRAAIAATVVALIALFPLLSAQSWGLKLLAVAIAAAAAASVTRLKVLPMFAGAVTYLGVLLIYLNAIFAGTHAVIGIVPTGSSLNHLWHVANQGWAARGLAPPVTGSAGVDLLAAAGIGLVAIATDLIAVRLRSPAIAGLPLLVLFSVPITTSAKPAGLGSSVTFCLAVIGFLALLAADGRERLRIWGRLITVWHGVAPDDMVRGPDTRSLAAAGRRIGLAAVCVAVIAPLLVPNLRLHDLFAKHDLPGSGGGSVELPKPLVQMQAQLTQARADQQTVLTYTTNNPAPPQQYLPIYVLNYDSHSQQFTSMPVGSSPSVNRGPQPVPGLKSNIPVTTFKTKITMSKSVAGYGPSASFLPVPYAPAVVTAPSAWVVDKATLMVWSSTAKLAGLSYTVTSTEPGPSGAELNMAQGQPPPSLYQYLGYNGPGRNTLLSLVKNITEHAPTTYEKAEALVNWFTAAGRFSYNLRPPWLAAFPGGMNGTELLDFLTVHRSGFCQQFAYAMAILARLIDIPSRIAVGYTAGVPEPANDKIWAVSEADAHAWPELYFKDIGWLRFEPTPSGHGGQATATQPGYGGSATSPVGGQGPGGPGSHTGAGGKSQGSGRAGKGGLHKFTTPDAGTAGSLPAGGGPPILPFVLIALALAAISPATARLLIRRNRWRRADGDAGLAHAAWQELREDLRDFGHLCRTSESPRAAARRVATAEELGSEAQQALDRLARAEERARYAVTPAPAGTLRADVSSVRRALAQQASHAMCWRARLMPPSVLAPVSAGLQQVLDVFGWMDAAGRRVRGPAREAVSRSRA